MLTHPTVDKLHELRCTGMAKALAEQLVLFPALARGVPT